MTHGTPEKIKSNNCSEATNLVHKSNIQEVIIGSYIVLTHKVVYLVKHSDL